MTQLTVTTYKECIDACIRCMNVCNVSYVSSLKGLDIFELRECLRLDRECADLCGVAIQAMTRNSPFVAEICELVAKACDACADECMKHKHEHCQECVEVCRECASICRSVLVTA
ncbi:four-helix bundle copper-binding protein [Saccharibacillus endophyticus]|uniref:Cysteine-rich protein YhjQ n=1 Tax=Saccharibacillus endophyticus TaxID=2060666 RepID=A0ABQ2A3E7_9BACL|nr:four-helix bundle copper-binding protein [Saccharibacillus endophyticus]GGH83728.1 putative cysteine-rich protein YhjQ [Saccharibacillus endophyticus]